MGEVAFAKLFLSQLDSAPVKLQENHEYDLREFSPYQPCVLPRLSDAHPPLPKKIKLAAVPGSSKAITVHLKSARNPVLDITLEHLPLSNATTQDLKEAVQSRIKPLNATSDDEKLSLDKIKILWKRKPVQNKPLVDVLSDEPDTLTGGKDVEFGVMVLGGATALPQQEIPVSVDTTPAVQENQQSTSQGILQRERSQNSEDTEDSSTVLRSEAFWEDLEGFMRMRLKDQEGAAKLRVLFRSAWESNL